MTKVRAVIFDMDGVIVDSEPRHERAFLEVVAELGYGDNHGLQFSDYLGRTDKELWVDFLARQRQFMKRLDLKEFPRSRSNDGALAAPNLGEGLRRKSKDSSSPAERLAW